MTHARVCFLSALTVLSFSFSSLALSALIPRPNFIEAPVFQIGTRTDTSEFRAKTEPKIHLEFKSEKYERMAFTGVVVFAITAAFIMRIHDEQARDVM